MLLASLAAVKVGNDSIGQRPPPAALVTEATVSGFFLASLTIETITTTNGSTAPPKYNTKAPFLYEEDRGQHRNQVTLRLCALIR